MTVRFTEEQLRKIHGAKTPVDLISYAGGWGVELSKEKAEAKYAAAHKSAYYQYAYNEDRHTWSLFSFMTGHYLELSETEKEQFDTLAITELPLDLFARLWIFGFITCIDEFSSLRNQTERAAARLRSSNLTVTICPSTDCNFACPYCIETGRKSKGNMTEETERQVVAFVRQLMEDNRARGLGVVWGGGEPTMALDSIERLSKALLELCHEKHYSYSAGMTTNGYLLTPDAMRRLNECQINSYKITLDGTAEIHDKNRMLKGGAPTYETIMNNLRVMKTDAVIEIRCNVSRTNVACVDALEKEVEQLRKETGNRISLHYVRTIVCRDVPKKLQSEMLTEEEFAKFAAGRESDHYALKRDAQDGLFCTACKRCNFVVDPQGNVFKCNSFLGQPEHILANVSEMPTLEQLSQKPDSEFFVTHSFPTLEKCLSCKLLPMCRGACPLDDDIVDMKRCNRFRLCPEEYVRKIARLCRPDTIG
ncbi:MAG: radical SAM protein [Eubacteriales bacterium]|nr:radical SAM protein [Eubacteriales bacterium]